MDVTLRDVPDEIDREMKARADRAGVSRQKYMLVHLEREFGDKGLPDVVTRLKTGIAAFEHCGGCHRKSPHLAMIAEAVGMASTRPMDDLLEGFKPFDFEWGFKICSYLGLSQRWLADGNGMPFERAEECRSDEELTYRLSRCTGEEVVWAVVHEDTQMCSIYKAQDYNDRFHGILLRKHQPVDLMRAILVAISNRTTAYPVSAEFYEQYTSGELPPCPMLPNRIRYFPFDGHSSSATALVKQKALIPVVRTPC